MTSELHKSSNEKLVFNPEADNHEVILSSQNHGTKQRAMDGIDAV
jgi:uncharacterized protein YegP (UPF0339 family)